MVRFGLGIVNVGGGLLLTLFSALGGCGGGKQGPAPAHPTPPPREQVRKAPPSQDMSVSGLYGTIPAGRIQRVMEGRLGAFQRCFSSALAELPFISGEIQFAFRVDARGRTEYVYVRNSSLGHRATERCLLERAWQAKFPAPAGGAPAEFTWGFAMDPPQDVAPPEPLDGTTIAQEYPEVLTTVQACAGQNVSVTAYVAPGGDPLAVGVAAETALDPTVLDCVAEGVAAQKLPNPLETAGKIQFAAR